MPERTPEEELLFNRATTIATTDIETLVHPIKAGSFDFEKSRTLLKQIKSFYADIATVSFQFVPSHVISEAVQRAEAIINAFGLFQTFNITASNPNENSLQVANNLKNQWWSTYLQMVDHLAYARISSANIQQEIINLRSVSAQIQEGATESAARYLKKEKESAEGFAQKAKEAEDKIRGELDRINEAIKEARAASALQGVAAQATEFDREARSCLIAARIWLAVTIMAVGISGFVIFFFFLYTPAKAPAGVIAPITETKAVTADFLEKTVARFLIVTLMSSVVVWFARNYSACRHNYTVNRHRRNAMQTFRAFVEGTKDPATQDFILRQAAACAFSPQQSGYLKDESLPSPGSTSQVMEAMKPETK